jgi:hypothetical protein
MQITAARRQNQRNCGISSLETAVRENHRTASITSCVHEEGHRRPTYLPVHVKGNHEIQTAMKLKERLHFGVTNH